MHKNKDLEGLHKSYTTLQNSLKNHNLLQAEKSRRDIYSSQDGMGDSIRSYLVEVDDEVESLKSIYSDIQSYAENLLELLKLRGLPAEVDDTAIRIGPLDVDIHVDEYYIQIGMGKKKKRFADLEPGRAAKHIEASFKRLNNSFSVVMFFKKLLKAYEIINIRMYNVKEVKYGFGVALKDVFELFTLSPAATDYKIENFLWDLGRLYTLTTKNTQFESYSFELGFSRNVNKMYDIKTAGGETLKASTLTIYKKVGKDGNK